MLRRAFKVAPFETRLPEAPMSAAAFRSMDPLFKSDDACHLFADQVTTDGFTACILLWKPCPYLESLAYQKLQLRSKKKKAKRARSEDPRYQLPEGYRPDVMIGIDPGARSLCTAVIEGVLRSIRPKRNRRRHRNQWLRTRCRHKRRKKNRHYRRGHLFIQVSEREYHHKARFNEFQAWHERLKRRQPRYAQALTIAPTLKTALFATYLQRLQYVWWEMNYLLDFCCVFAFRKWRFARYVGKQKVLGSIKKRLVPKVDRQVCVAVGDFHQHDGTKGHPPSPIMGLVAALRKRATVVLIDEYRTSKLCADCINALSPTRLWSSAAEKLRSNKTVLRCESSECKADFWNRDVNAACNMLTLLKVQLSGEGRPEAFDRK